MWQCSRNEPALNYDTDFDIDNITDLCRFKTIITGFANDAGAKDVEIALLLKHLSNIQWTFEMSLINCETNLTLLKMISKLHCF